MERTAAVIPRECKRLAEVDFPLAVVSKHALREKNIRHGTPSTLHLWWARRPLASSRAVLLALLLPDPCDSRCPGGFKAQAREMLKPVPGDVGQTDEDLREALLRFIGDFANWDHAASSTFLEAGRGLVRAAHPDDTPLVADPFAGGGSIPLEALRLGCDAFASDLNPVAPGWLGRICTSTARATTTNGRNRSITAGFPILLMSDEPLRISAAIATFRAYRRFSRASYDKGRMPSAR